MAITFVGGLTGISTGVGEVIDLGPLGLAENDIVLAFAAASSGSGSPAGYTGLGSHTAPNSSLDYKVMGAIPDADVTFFDPGGGSDEQVAGVAAFRGVDTANPIDVTTIEVTGSANPPNAGSITPTSNNCMIVIFGATDERDNSGVTTPTNYTQAFYNFAGGGGGFPTIAAAYRLLSGGAGSPENPDAWTGWSNTTGQVAYTVALRPAAAGQPFYLREGDNQFPSAIRGINIPGMSIWRARLRLRKPRLFVPRKPRLIWV